MVFVQAREALQLAVRSMPVGARFNIIRFGSTTVSVFSEAVSVVADDAALAKATTVLSTMEADLGGTEVMGSLQVALAPPEDASARPSRCVVMFTDGEVGNTAEVKAYVADAQKVNPTPVYCFGIGSSVSF